VETFLEAKFPLQFPPYMKKISQRVQLKKHSSAEYTIGKGHSWSASFFVVTNT
jgi:hypothetical protein